MNTAQNLFGYSDFWTEEDIRDFATHSARYIASQLPEDDDLLPSPEESAQMKAE